MHKKIHSIILLIDFDLLQMLQEPHISQYVRVQRNNDKNIINKDYIVQADGTPRPLVRNANFRRIRFGNDPRERDPFRLRNRLFLFRP